MPPHESSYCPACNSFFHSPESCPKSTKILPPYQPVSNLLIGPATTSQEQHSIDNRTNDLSLELQLRSIFANGVGNEGCRCNKHRIMQSQMLGEVPNSRHACVPIVLDAFDDSCVLTRTLLPICSTCVHAETGLGEAALASGLDMCPCATMLAKAECPNCVLSQINGAFKYDVLTRTKPSTESACEIACTCGKVIATNETAKQCVYCRGIATAPFLAYGGQKLDFERGAKVPMLSCERQMPDGKNE